MSRLYTSVAISADPLSSSLLLSHTFTSLSVSIPLLLSDDLKQSVPILSIHFNSVAAFQTICRAASAPPRHSFSRALAASVSFTLYLHMITLY